MTTKRPRFNPFPKLDMSRGAPMGRCSTRHDFSGLTPDDLCVSHPQGEYDSGGAYWGIGYRDGPVYAVWQRGRGHDGVFYVRAHGARAAKHKALGWTVEEAMYLGMSSDPTSPLGISQWGEWGTGNSFEEYREENSAHLIDWADLPEHIRAHVVARATED